MQGRVRMWQHSVPPSDDPRENARRKEAVELSARLFVFGALTALKEYEPHHYSSIAIAADNVAFGLLKGGEPEFVVQRLSRRRWAAEAFLGPGLVGLHDELVKRLRQTWRELPAGEFLRVGRFVSPTRRYSAAAYRGSQLRHRLNEHRGRVLQVALKELMPAFEDLDQKLDARKAGALVRASRSPAQLSLAVLAHLSGVKTRAITAILNRARKRLRAAERHRAVLDQWGYKRLAPKSVS